MLYDKRNWRNSPYYSPFGGGPRLCPGAELARLQIALFLHYFIVSYRFDFTLQALIFVIGMCNHHKYAHITCICSYLEFNMTKSVTRFRWSEVKEDRMSFFPSARLVNGFPIQLSKRA
ncbi:putative abieta-7,13-dien-18-ol hydroxylase [Helianthus anomalus]